MDKKNQKKIPGIYTGIKKVFSEEESNKICKELYEKRFFINYKTEGTRHGNGFIPIDFNEEIDNLKEIFNNT